MASSKKTTTNSDDGETAVLAAIAAMPQPDRSIGEQLHTIVKDNAPELIPRTWYGMPAYSNGDKIVCYFRSRQKFGERYITFGFNDIAKLDDGSMWPIVYALTDLSEKEKTMVAKLMKQAIGK